MSPGWPETAKKLRRLSFRNTRAPTPGNNRNLPPRSRVIHSRSEPDFGRFGAKTHSKVPHQGRGKIKPGPLSKPGNVVCWRRGRDLNPRTGFKPRYPLSRRAPSANSATSPQHGLIAARRQSVKKKSSVLARGPENAMPLYRAPPPRIYFRFG